VSTWPLGGITANERTSERLTERATVKKQGTDKGKPEAGKIYALTGGKGTPSIAAGNTWAESEVTSEVTDEPTDTVSQHLIHDPSDDPIDHTQTAINTRCQDVFDPTDGPEPDIDSIEEQRYEEYLDNNERERTTRRED
jgi:hypothetical protein